MANKTSYVYQKELLIKLREQLLLFKDDLVNTSSNYQTAVQNLHDKGGLMDEIYEEYNINYLHPISETINSIILRIDAEDIAFIDSELNFLSSR